ncbi:MAG: hypothetical protein JST68_02990 [Bacteroidetes bacterium]|nr:hypothetical protein [Bacteroidota bacterium]
MPTFDISINIYIFLLIIVTAALAGFLLKGSRKLVKKDRQIKELEQELVQAHAELLESQKEFCDLESRVRETPSPVITMKNSKEEPPQKPGEQRDRPTGTTGTD